MPYLKDETSVETLAMIIEKAIYNKKPKEHHMDNSENINDIELKGMNKIGG